MASSTNSSRSVHAPMPTVLRAPRAVEVAKKTGAQGTEDRGVQGLGGFRAKLGFPLNCRLREIAPQPRRGLYGACKQSEDAVSSGCYGFG